ncbi:hypothetical protein H4R33_001367 [Dimargaris cristalligena]|nr:hypothetical protein H4R33_001367 [Dimargaris cristalligena]
MDNPSSKAPNVSSEFNVAPLPPPTTASPVTSPIVQDNAPSSLPTGHLPPATHTALIGTRAGAQNQLPAWQHARFNPYYIPRNRRPRRFTSVDERSTKRHYPSRAVPALNSVASSPAHLSTNSQSLTFGQQSSQSPSADDHALSPFESAKGLAEPDCSTQCPICLQTISEAHVTACGHSFCYTCISRHLRRSATCPNCRAALESNQIFPNYALNHLLERTRPPARAPFPPAFQRAQEVLQTQSWNRPEDIDILLGLLLNQRRALQDQAKRTELSALLVFLNKAKASQEELLVMLQQELACVQKDITDTQMSLHGLGHEPALTSAKSPHVPTLSAPISAKQIEYDHSDPSLSLVPHQASNELAGPLLADFQTERITQHFEDLQLDYFEHRLKAPYEPNLLNQFSRTLAACASSKQLRHLATLRIGEGTRSSAIIASIGFDRDCEYFATAGVNNRIRVFAYDRIQRLINSTTARDMAALAESHYGPVDDQVQSDRPDSRSLTDDGLLPHYYPTYELTCRNKISCLSWNPYVKSLIANSDYTGVVTLWDVHTGVETLTWSEHAKRIWSLDFSRTDPNRLASGGDDTKVKIWCMRQSQSALTLDGRANVCCVQFNPTVSHCLALGTADHHIYYYDLRNPNTPVTTMKGHRKAVSFVRFINGRELVSASIDNSLKTWSLDRPRSVFDGSPTLDSPTENAQAQALTHGIPESNPLGIGQRTYRGHTNEKNFVGLSVRNDWITCGSETNCVFTYHRALSQPVFRTPFDQELPSTTNQVLPTPTNPATPSFVSAVCWKPDADVLLAASSHGTIRTFHLV